MSNPHGGAFTVARHPQFSDITGHFHLHSIIIIIIIEIIRLHLLNTEHRERNAWKHFNLREVGKRAGGRGAGGEPGDEVIRTVWQMIAVKPRRVMCPLLAELESCWSLWHFLGCLHFHAWSLQGRTSQRDMMGGPRWHDVDTVLSF